MALTFKKSPYPHPRFAKTPHYEILKNGSVVGKMWKPGGANFWLTDIPGLPARSLDPPHNSCSHLVGLELCPSLQQCKDFAIQHLG
jgi:hypothetical protein